MMATATVVITESSAITPTITLTQQASCAGGMDGSLNLAVTGGTAPYAFAWSNGDTTQNVDSLMSGSYTVTITDAKGCSVTATGNVTSPSGITVSTSVIHNQCAGANAGSITVTPTGGTTPYTYAWSNGGSTTNALTGLAGGSYTITITDANGCDFIETNTVNEPTAIMSSITASTVLCFGDMVDTVDLMVSGGTAPYTFAWNNSATTEDLFGVMAGTYMVTITDANNCTKMDTVTVTEPTALSLSTSATDDNNNAAQGDASVTATGGTAPYTYLWSNGGTMDMISGLTAGTYTVTVTDANGCTANASATVNNVNTGIAEIVVVGSGADLTALSLDERDAYQWAIGAFPNLVQYRSFADINTNGIPAEAKVIWFHLQSVDTIRPDAATAAGAVETFLNAGNGLLLSGHATKYVVNTNVTTVGSTETINNTAATADSAWGFRPLAAAATHPIFDGLPASIWPDANWGGFRTVDAGTPSQETISWWTGDAFPGTKLAGLPWLADDGLTTCGELAKGDGKVLVASAPGFAWGSTAPQGGQPRANLELFTENMLMFLYPAPAYDIATVATVDADGVADSLGVRCKLTGTVYGVDFRGGNGFSFTIIDATDGINVFSFDDVSGYTVNEGDEIEVIGEIDQFNGLTEIIPETITLIGTGTLKTPTDVTALDESTESDLVRITNVSLVDPAQWTNSGSGFNVDITDGTNTYTMRIDNDCDLYGTNAPTTQFHVTGIGGQFDNSSPYTDGYQIFPRYQADIVSSVNTNHVNFASSITMYPNPAKDQLYIETGIAIDIIRISNVLGQEVRTLNAPQPNTTIDVSNFVQGVYHVTFVTAQGAWTTQFVKK